MDESRVYFHRIPQTDWTFIADSKRQIIGSVKSINHERWKAHRDRNQQLVVPNLDAIISLAYVNIPFVFPDSTNVSEEVRIAPRVSIHFDLRDVGYLMSLRDMTWQAGELSGFYTGKDSITFTPERIIDAISDYDWESHIERMMPLITQPVPVRKVIHRAHHTREI